MTTAPILVVDDEPVMREVVGKTLANAGYSVTTADDGEAGWDSYVAKQPALVITDIYMPRLNGLMLLRRIRRDSINAKVILITGYSHYKQLLEDQASRPDGYFEKPFDTLKLIRKVEQLIGPPPRQDSTDAAAA